MAIFGVAALVIAAMWIFQVFLLQSIYLAGKKSQFIADTNTMVSSIQQIQQGDLLTSYDLISDLGDLAVSNSYYLEIADAVGNPMMSYNAMGERSVLKNNSLVRSQVLYTLQLEQNQNNVLFFEDTQSSTSQDYYICAVRFTVAGQELTVLTETALAPVGEAVDAIRGQLIWVSIVLLLIATGIALYISRSIAKPVKQLSQATREIAKGNLLVQVPVQGKDELSVLAQDFNIMSKEISKATALQRELVANVSHDIRTPLTMIKGYAETIKDLTGNNPEKRNQQLDIIIDESNRLNVLVNDILDLSKLQAGQQKMNFIQFDLAQKLRDIVGRYALLESEEQYQISLSAPEHYFIVGDEVKIEQVIYNILNNAVNHTGADKKIFITLDDSQLPGRVLVRDTGKGIAPEDLPLIWDRYYKPYKKDDRKGMGTGLGLSIVKAILEAHHFAYGVDSRLGEGSTFWFETAPRGKKREHKNG